MGLQEDINQTINYYKKFKTNLSKKEIEEKLISKNIYKGKDIKKVLEKRKDKVDKNIWVKEKTNKAKKISLWIEKTFKDILFLGISGSVAINHPKENDDIDFFIITKKNRLWLSRLELRFLIFIKGIPHRRSGRKERKDQFCFNLWLEEDKILLSKDKQKLRNAIDLMSLKPLINKEMTYERLLLENNWASNFLANAFDKKTKGINKEKIKINKDKRYSFKSVLNFLVFWPQYWYMSKKITKEIINYKEAFFHN